MKTIMVVYGTRPEAIKVAPIIQVLQDSPDFTVVPVSTGQHQRMLDRVNEIFGIVPQYDLSAFEQGQNLNTLSSKIFNRLDPILEEVKPDALMVQGDTSTVAIAAIAAFYREIPVIHLEAGLRSHDIYSPFPEEANRKITSQVTRLHLAPTAMSQDNLLREGVDPNTIVVTGNTVIDALMYVAEQDVEFRDKKVREAYESDRPLLLLTTHRRENWGEPMRRIGTAIHEIADRLPNWTIVYPAHANPKVRASIAPHIENNSNVVICDALDYDEFSHLMKRARIIVSDSGGVQEEAPSLGKPVLVLRDNTERPEAVEAGTVRLVGTETQSIVDAVLELVNNETAYEEMINAINPYGDGHAAEHAVRAMREMLNEPEPSTELGPTTVEVDKPLVDDESASE